MAKKEWILSLTLDQYTVTEIEKHSTEVAKLVVILPVIYIYKKKALADEWNQAGNEQSRKWMEKLEYWWHGLNS